MTNAEFEKNIGIYRNYIFSYINKKIKNNHSIAEDITQKTFIKALNYFREHPLKKASYKSLLFLIADCAIIDFYKKDKEYRNTVQFPLYEEQENIDSILIESDFSIKFIDKLNSDDIIKLGLEELRNKNNDLYKIFMKAIDDIDYQKIADSENIPLNTVKTRVHRSRKFLQKYLESKNITISSLTEIEI